MRKELTICLDMFSINKEDPFYKKNWDNRDKNLMKKNKELNLRHLLNYRL